MTSDAEILEAVADGYESGRYGWIQGRYDAPEGFCAMGALYYEHRKTIPNVWATSPEAEEAQEALGGAANHLYEAIQEFEGFPYPKGIPGWNDQYGRTKDEVIDVFKRAAKNARNQETP